MYKQYVIPFLKKNVDIFGNSEKMTPKEGNENDRITMFVFLNQVNDSVLTQFVVPIKIAEVLRNPR